MPTAREIMEKAAILLQDEEHIRWPLDELAGWINDAVSAIILAKPSASSESRVMELDAGTLQRVPQNGGQPQPLMLVRVVRNLRSAGTGGSAREGGRIITATDRATLDALSPYWHDRNYVPFRREVRQYVYDEANPLEFYAYPGNDGNGLIEIIVSVIPARVVAQGDATEIASWGMPVGLPEPYSVPLLDYVLYRSFSKDAEGADPGRAGAHYTQFATAIGLKIEVERATSPNAKR